MDRVRFPVFLFLLSATVASSWLISCGDDNPLAPTGGGEEVNGVDSIPPAAVHGLAAKSPTSSSIALQWVAPGDDGVRGQASRYEIRYSLSTIDNQSWDSAIPVPDSLLPKPVPGGQIQKYRVLGLPSARDVYFALKTYDEASNVSPISNSPKGTTTAENIPPAAVKDLSADAISDSDIRLTWTAPGDDGVRPGVAALYDVRYSINPITESNFAYAEEAVGEPTPSQCGETESFVVVGLRYRMDYYFALKTSDEVDNWSELSNNGFALAMSNYLMASPTDVYLGQHDSVAVMFRTRSEAERCVVNISRMYYTGGNNVFRHLVDGHYPAGSHFVGWDLKTDDGDYVTDWYAGVKIMLYLDGEPMDTVSLRIFPES